LSVFNIFISNLGSRKTQGAFNPNASLAVGTNFQATHQSTTVPMNFRGQDKGRDTALGGNPNLPVEDEYISNLQQQIHFMELELKILKEKVVDDEKKSGIGSLFDDDKTSFQHIQQLKEKYSQMRLDFDIKIEALNKSKLKVIGDQFVLNAQIDLMLNQNDKLNTDMVKKDRGNNNKVHDLTNENKQMEKQRADVEHDIKTMNLDNKEEQESNYEQKMYQLKEKEFDDLALKRHELEMAECEKI
jgi:hypothetical protein